MGTGGHSHPLWFLDEAALELRGDGGRIGWVQVGLSDGLEFALPPLVQCFDDALRRHGDVDGSALQISGYSVQVRGDLLAPDLGWFGLSLGPKISGILSLDRGFVGRASRAEFVANLQGWNGAGAPQGQFVFGSPVAIPRQFAITDPTSASPIADEILVPAEWGLPVEMPEWTPMSMAWILATVVAAARRDPTARHNFAVRLTKVS